MFTAFNSVQNLSAKILKDDGQENLGFYSLASIYLFFSISSVFATGIINRLGIRVSLMCSSFCYFLWIFSFMIPAYRF
jgi:hypothetical protein